METENDFLKVQLVNHVVKVREVSLDYHFMD